MSCHRVVSGRGVAPTEIRQRSEVEAYELQRYVIGGTRAEKFRTSASDRQQSQKSCCVSEGVD